MYFVSHTECKPTNKRYPTITTVQALFFSVLFQAPERLHRQHLNDQCSPKSNPHKRTQVLSSGRNERQHHKIDPKSGARKIKQAEMGSSAILLSRLFQPEKSFRVKPKNVCQILITDLCPLHFLQSRAMLIACRVGVKEATKDQPLRPHCLHELPDVARAANMCRVKQDIRSSLRDFQHELAIHIRRQGIQGDKGHLWNFQG